MHPSQEAHVGKDGIISMEKLLDFWLSQLNIDIGLTRHIEICSAMASIESQVSFAFSKLSGRIPERMRICWKDTILNTIPTST